MEADLRRLSAHHSYIWGKYHGGIASFSLNRKVLSLDPTDSLHKPLGSNLIVYTSSDIVQVNFNYFPQQGWRNLKNQKRGAIMVQEQVFLKGGRGCWHLSFVC